MPELIDEGEAVADPEKEADVVRELVVESDEEPDALEVPVAVAAPE
jgi:hypothetical protein